MNGGDRYFVAANNDKMIMKQVMQRFRPIAPKPVSNGSVSGQSDPDNKKELVSIKRTKRKYVRVKSVKNIVRNNNKKNNKVKEREDWFDETVVTFELFPEIGKSSSERGISKDLDCSVMHQLNLNTSENNYHVSDLTTKVPGLAVVESWVTMECVTDLALEEGRLGNTDREKVNNLEMDTCPGFVSDGANAVRWVNLAYRRLVAPREGGGSLPEVMVWLAVKERFPVGRDAFSCRVRVVYGGGRGKVVPCDVWRMEFGGFTWRLDVEAALSLGRN